MAGKVTHLHGVHESSEGGIVEPVKLTDEAIEQLNFAIGRTLLSIELEQIEGALGVYRHMMQWPVVPLQDIKRTLLNISKLSDIDAVDAYSIKCDEQTRCEILTVLYTSRDIFGKNCEQDGRIQAAAKIALENVSNKNNAGGAPTKSYQTLFATASLDLWRCFNGGSETLWCNESSKPENSLSPLLKWTVALFSELERRPFDWSKAQRLLRKVSGR